MHIYGTFYPLSYTDKGCQQTLVHAEDLRIEKKHTLDLPLENKSVKLSLASQKSSPETSNSNLELLFAQTNDLNDTSKPLFRKFFFLVGTRL